MGIFSKFERRMEDTVEGAADKMSGAPLSPVQIAKKAEKQMRREKMVGAGKQYAPTLYTVLVNQSDDERLFGYYPTLAGETETYLAAKAAEQGLVMDGQPLVRFIVDDDLRRGKFEVIAEMVAAPLVSQLRHEEMERYGLVAPHGGRGAPHQPNAPHAAGRAPQSQQTQMPHAQSAYDLSGYAGEAGYAGGAEHGHHGGYHADDLGGSVGAGATFHAGAAAGAGAGAIAGAGAAAAAGAPRNFNRPHTFVFDPTNPHQQADPYDDPHAPAIHRAAYLYDITNDRAFTLSGDPMQIGRESNNHIVVPDINASRLHAEIVQDENGEWSIIDLGSTNGTYVNRRRIDSAPLYDSDLVTIGTTQLEFQIV